MTMNAKMYRYEDVCYSSGSDVDSEFFPGFKLELSLREFNVLRKTPKGKWIDLGWGDERFVLDKGRKRFAWETERDALNSFIIRKQRQIGYLKAQIERAEIGLKKGEGMMEELINNREGEVDHV
jgi:hypothetical protein